MKRNRLNLIFGAIYLVIIILIFINFLKTEFVIGLLSVTTAIYFGMLQQKIQNDKMFYDLFHTFNERYDNDFNDFFNRIREGSVAINEDDILTNKIKVIDYMNFCAEEYLWYSKGRIPKDIWKNWRSGILSNLEIDWIFNVYNEEMKEFKSSYYGLDKELNDNGLKKRKN